MVVSGPADVGERRGESIRRREESSLVAVSRMKVRRGRSLEDWKQA